MRLAIALVLSAGAVPLDPIEAKGADRWPPGKLREAMLKDTLDYKTVRKAGEEELARCQASRPTADECLDLLISLGYNTGPAGDPIEGVRYARAAVALAERTLPVGHPDIERSLMSLLTSLEYQRDFAAAESVHRRIVALREAELPRDSAKIFTAMTEFANNLVAQGRISDAETAFRQTLVAAEGFGDDELIVAALGNLGFVLHLQRSYTEAEAIYRRLLVMGAKVVGPDSEGMAKIIQNLGASIEGQDRLPEAEALFRQAIEIQQKTSFYTASTSAETELNLASNLLKQRRLVEAERYARRALAAWDYLYRFDPKVRIGGSILADILTKQGRFEEAEQLYRNSASIGMGLPPHHPDYIGSVRGLAGYLQERGVRLAEARSLYVAAGAGVMLRIGTYAGFNRTAERELRMFRPVFLGQVRNAWTLARKGPSF